MTVIAISEEQVGVGDRKTIIQNHPDKKILSQSFLTTQRKSLNATKIIIKLLS